MSTTKIELESHDTFEVEQPHPYRKDLESERDKIEAERLTFAHQLYNNREFAEIIKMTYDAKSTQEPNYVIR